MTDADLCVALASAWDNDALLPTLVTGGLHFHRADKDATDPYAVYTVKPQEPDFATEGVAFLPYLVSVAVYSAAGAFATKPIAKRLQQAFGTELLVSDARPLATFRAAGEFRHDEARRDQQDVVRLTAAWKMTFVVQ